MKGYYSLIQFCPDRSRLEAANIGVVLVCPERKFIDSKIVESNDKLRRFFHGLQLDFNLIKFQKKVIKRRIFDSCAQLINPDNLKTFAQTRGNQILVTEPRSIRVDGDPALKLDQLFAELVGERTERTKTRDFEQQIVLKLDQSLQNAGLTKSVKRQVSVNLKSLDRTITAPIGYQNGRFNLVVPREFAQSNSSSAETAACRLAVEGNALYKHPDEHLGKLQLVVVCSFKTAAQTVHNRIEGILADSNVQMYSTSKLQDLVQHIKQSAHT
jgi:hypothetical protein